MAESDLLDESVLGTIASLQRPGAPDLVSRVLGLFADDAPRHVAGIVDGSDRLDLERVRIAAHTLKSSAGNVGATRLAARCADIEQAARDANPVACVALSDALGDMLADTLSALDAFAATRTGRTGTDADADDAASRSAA